MTGLDWAVPDFSPFCRRQKTLKVGLPYRCGTDPLNLLIGSAGIKAEGEGGWNARMHDGPKRRIWRRIPIGIDEETLEVRAAEITAGNVGDASVLPEMLAQIPSDRNIGSVTVDGAYGTRKCDDAIAARVAQPVISPRKNAQPRKSASPRGGVSPGTKRSTHRDTWTVPRGGDGADITAKAVDIRGSCIGPNRRVIRAEPSASRAARPRQDIVRRIQVE